MSTNIWWIRRDLRIKDNMALQSALKTADQVIPVFILDPLLLNSQYSSSKRQAFLFGGLAALDSELRELVSYLVVQSGDPALVLQSIRQATNATAIYAEADHSPYARQRDATIQQNLPLNLVGSPAILNPGSVLKPDGAPYTVFTPFSKAWKMNYPRASSPHPKLPSSIHTPPGIFTEPLPAFPVDANPAFPPGELEASRRLSNFLSATDDGIYGYANNRDRMDVNGTSRLSPYFRFGMLSARQAASSALRVLEAAPNNAGQRGAETWLNELIWRDFYIHILEHFPGVRKANFRSLSISWQQDEAALAAWQQGKTGYPVVDAAMRQLMATGWMHNRARMITASFLTKHLLIHWSEGERWFMQHLIDGDPAANNGGWQWTAGTGTDAAPFFRIFNPILQSQKHDPTAGFIRTWVPELQSLDLEYIHEPWKMPSRVQTLSNCIIGKDYPHPIVDHAFARQRALAAFAQIK